MRGKAGSRPLSSVERTANMESELKQQHYLARILAAIAPRCPVCKASNIGIARNQRGGLWSTYGACRSCQIRFRLNPFQVALHLQQIFVQGPPLARSEQEPTKSPPEESAHEIPLTLATRAPRSPKTDLHAEPCPVRAIETITAEISGLMSQLTVAIISSLRERDPVLEPTKGKTGKRKKTNPPAQH